MLKHYRVGHMAILLLFVVFSNPTTLFGQDNGAIIVTGSGIVAPLFEAFVDAVDDDVNVSLTVTGTRTGFEGYCAGETDVVIVNRPITVEEQAVCQENEVEFLEFLGGHNILTLIAHPDAEVADCLTLSDVNTVYAPSSEGEITNWNQIIDSNPDLTLALFVPPSDSPTFVLLDGLSDGDGVRGDATTGTDDDDVVTSVAETEGALGAVTLNAAQSAGDDVQILELDVSDLGCAVPTAENVEGRLYTGANRLFFYINPSALDTHGMTELLEFIFGDQSRAVAEDAGFTAVTAEGNGRNQEILTTANTGRVFSRDVVAFQIPESLTGQIAIAGAALGEPYMQSLSTAFTSQNFATVTDVQALGEPIGFRRLCNDEIDVVIAFGDPSDERLENCEANNVGFRTFDLGGLVVLMVSNENTPYLTCLTTDQLTTVWRAETADDITNWSQVDEAFDDLEMTLFGPQPGSTLADVLMLTASGESLARRIDIELDNDPLYRAAATANVEGALTYMTWDDYQQVLDNQQANIQLMSVDAGRGCIEPSLETIANGSYALVMQGRLFVNDRTLASLPIQAFLWFAMSDENFDLLEDAGFVGIEFAELVEIRDELQAIFEVATAAELERLAEEAAANGPDDSDTETDATDDFVPDESSDSETVVDESESDESVEAVNSDDAIEVSNDEAETESAEETPSDDASDDADE